MSVKRSIHTQNRSGVHFSGVGFSTSVHFTKAAATDNSMYAKVVHRQLQQTILSISALTLLVGLCSL